MDTPFLNIDIPVTFRDQPGVQSAVLYTDINLCNLNCFQCHNRASYDGRSPFFTYDELSSKLEFLKLLGVELIIISGGEPFLSSGLSDAVKFIRQKMGFPVRIDTNGTFPEKIADFIKRDIVDGFALDVKIPLKNSFTDEEKNRFKEILFSNPSVSDKKLLNYVKNVKKSIELIKQFIFTRSKKFTIFRTVRYPLLKEEDFEFIKSSVVSDVYLINDFFALEGV